MNKFSFSTPVYLFFLALTLASCAVTHQTTNHYYSVGEAPNKNAAKPGADGKISINLLHLNDVYEIAPLENGKVAGMARVAHLERTLSAANPNTYMVHAGDFLSPSAIGTLKYGDGRIGGQQMVDVMNAAGVDLVTFGNHEFDLKEAELQQRLNEGRYDWVSSNVWQLVGIERKDKVPFHAFGKSVPRFVVKTFQDADGTNFHLGFIAVSVDDAKPGYVAYDDYRAAARWAYNAVKDSCDAVVAITHLLLEQDRLLAKELPEVPIFLGGHDHNNMYDLPTPGTRVVKADANAKTVYVHHLTFDHATKKLEIKSELVQINDKMPEDPKTAAVVKKWEMRTDSLLRLDGFDARAVVTTLAEPLDGRESVIRFEDCPLSQMVVKSYGFAFPEADCAILNTGSIRIDDIVSGQITEYDVLRILPFGGKITLVEMKGELLRQIVETGRTTNVGIGGFLALDRIVFDPKTKSIAVNGQALVPDKVYRVSMPDFLLTGKESNLRFLTEKNTGISKITQGDPDKSSIRNDVRKAFIAFLRR